jgi:predicted cupin superfamily sugar epimerase
MSMRSASGDERDASTAIYYLLTPDTFSAMHRLPGDELFHFYLGDPVEMLQLRPDGVVQHVVIGNDLAAGMQPQVIVAGGVWQGCRLRDGGRVALMGTTMSPGSRDSLIASYPDARDAILQLARD